MKIVKRIKITCTGTDYLNIDELEEFQGDIKRLSNDQFDRLKKSILKYGFSAPMFIWKTNGSYKILDGHQRLSVLNYLKEEYDIPPLPVVYIDAVNEKTAKEKLLHIASQYGAFNDVEIELFMEELDSDIAETLSLVESPIAFNDIDVDVLFDEDAEPSASMSRAPAKTMSFWIYDYMIKDERSDTLHFVKDNLEEIKKLDIHDVVDVIISGLKGLLK
jgi:hypothetical protein